MADKLVLLIDSLGSGGAQRQICLLGAELAAAGHDVTLVYYQPFHHMRGILEGSNVKIKEIRLPEDVSKLQKLLRIVRELRLLRPTHVISFIDGPNLAAGLAKLMGCGFTWVPSERNLNVSTTWREVLWRSVLFVFAKSIVCNSFSQSEWIKKNIFFAKNKTRTIVNGISKSFFDSEGTDPFSRVQNGRDFVILGRVAPQKNPQLLLSAVELLDEDQRSRFRFSWFGEEEVGYPGWRAELQDECLSRKLPIHFFPATSDPQSVVRDASALILCSDHEGTPNVVLEAMALGTPVIASDVSDVPRLLNDGSRGLVFRAGDAVDMANAIRRFLRLSRPEIENMTEAANAFVKSECSPQAMSSKFLQALGL